MNETLKNITERYSCRDFADTPLTSEQIQELVTAALAAPSARNLQPWHVTVVTDKGLIDELDKEGVATLAAEDETYYTTIKERGGRMFYNAPCAFIVTHNGSSWGDLDSGILCQNVVLTAQSLGLSTCIVGLLRVPLNSRKGEEFKKRLQFKEGHDFAIGVLIGTAKTGKVPHELDHSKVTLID